LRDLFLRGLVLGGAAAALITEVLSPFHLLNRWTLGAFWAAMLAFAVWRLWSRPLPYGRGSVSGFAEWGIAVAIGAIAACIGLAAALAPPNSADAMAYHMPRVVYWAQAGSVAFFPTPYFNQVMLGPMAEYLNLHSYLISGGDHFINLLTFGAWLASIVAVSTLAGAMGLGRLGQWLAALFCATLPDGILQASGAKNDWLLTLWLIAAVYFTVRRDAPFAGLALGLALLTKATGYLFAPGVLAVAWFWKGRWQAKSGTDPQIGAPAPLWIVAGILLLNTPQYWRNWRLSGSPLGYDSAQGDGFFRWRNEHLRWRAAVSNLLRNGSEQLGARSERWNQGVYDAVLRAHQALKLDPQDPDTTWRWSRYETPRNANHEANANNRWHLLLLGAAFVWAAWRKERRWIWYGGALAAGFLLFCFYLKWQPFQARLELPLFVLGAPLGGWLLERLRPRALTALVCLFLVGGARLPAVDNWTRPLKGPTSLFRTSRESNYFADMGQWGNRASYLQAVEAAAQSPCDVVGIDISENQLEYPFQALLRERKSKVQFVHTGLGNATQACAVLCPDCEGNDKKLATYAGYGSPLKIGRFWWFGPPVRP
jgi:hypothetical protein